MKGKRFIKDFRIAPGDRIQLSDINPDEKGDFQKHEAQDRVQKLCEKMDDLQQRMRERAEHRHARVGRLHCLPDAHERRAETAHGPPAEPGDQAAHRHDDHAPFRRRATDALQKAFTADDRIEAVAVRDVLDGVQQQREQHAAEARANARQYGDDGKADQ